MTARSVDFIALNNPELAREAARVFFCRTFREYPLQSYLLLTILGAILLITSAVNRNVYGAEFGAGMLALVLFRFPMIIWILPGLAAYGSKRHPEIHLRVGPTEIAIIKGRGSPTLPLRKKIQWEEFRAIWEYQDFFVLVFNSSNYWCLPKQSMPKDVYSLISDIATSKAKKAKR